MQHVRRVQHRAAVEARVQVAPGRCAPRRSACDQPARAERDRRRALVDHQRVEHDRAVGLVLAGPQALEHRRCCRPPPRPRRGSARSPAARPRAPARTPRAAAAGSCPCRRRRRARRGGRRARSARTAGCPSARAARRPARRSGRRRAPSGASARASSAARRRPSGGRRRSRPASALPPAASIRSQTQSHARAQRRPRPRPRSRPTGSAASRRAPRASVGTAGCRRVLHAMRRLFLLVSAVVLVDTMFFAAVAPLLPHYSRRARPLQDGRRRAHGRLSRRHVRRRAPGRLARRALGRQADAARSAWRCSASRAWCSRFAEHIVLLDAARFVQGVGGACMWAAGMAWLVSAAPRRPARRADRLGARRGDRRRAARPGARRRRHRGRPGGRVQRRRRSWPSALAVWAWTMPGVPPEPSPGVRGDAAGAAPGATCSPASGCSPCRRCSPA